MLITAHSCEAFKVRPNGKHVIVERGDLTLVLDRAEAAELVGELLAIAGDLAAAEEVSAPDIGDEDAEV